MQFLDEEKMMKSGKINCSKDTEKEDKKVWENPKPDELRNRF